MTVVDRHPLLLSNAEVRANTERLMIEHAAKLDRRRPGYLATYVEAATSRAKIERASVILANPTVTDADKVLAVAAIFDGAAPFLPFARGAS